MLDGLPGIATNLLAARLKALEGDGIIRRTLPESGSRGISYELMRPSAVSTTLAIVVDDETVRITRDSRGLSVNMGARVGADVTVAGLPDAIMGLLGGFASVHDRELQGLQVHGSKTALRRVLARADF